VLRQVLATGSAPAALESDDITSGLVAAGVLVAVDAPADLVSRRSFVSAAAAVGAMGIVTLALPRAAAASSVVDPSLVPPPPDTVVEAKLTGIEYPPGGNVDAVGVRWQESDLPGGGSFSFRVRIEAFMDKDFNQFNPTRVLVTSGVLLSTSGDDYQTILVPGWNSGEWIRVFFETVGLQTEIQGDTRSTQRQL
jgi:hypothetical protein